MSNNMRMLVIKVITKLPYLIVENLKTKISLFWFWRSKRHLVVSWIKCWLISSSLFVIHARRSIPRIFKNSSISIKLKNNVVFFADPSIWYDLGHILAFNNYYEFALFNLNNKSKVIDIGAHLGYFCIPAAVCGATVIAFEPEPNNFALLSKNVDINSKLLQNRLKVFNLAVCERCGEVVFLQSEKSTRGSIKDVSFTLQGNSVNEVCCSSIDLNTIFDENNLDTVDLLKIDCEGAEYNIFFNVDDSIFNRINSILMEAHLTEKNLPEDMRDFLKSKGYILKNENSLDKEAIEYYFVKV